MGKDRKLRLDDLKEQHREYAELIGVENFIHLSEVYGGTTIYIPKMDDLLKNSRYAAIMQEFDGTNIRQLARKYHVSERTIYRLVRGLLKTASLQPMEGQTSLFDRNL